MKVNLGVSSVLHIAFSQQTVNQAWVAQGRLALDSVNYLRKVSHLIFLKNGYSANHALSNQPQIVISNETQVKVNTYTWVGSKLSNKGAGHEI